MGLNSFFLASYISFMFSLNLSFSDLEVSLLKASLRESTPSRTRSVFRRRRNSAASISNEILPSGDVEGSSRAEDTRASSSRKDFLSFMVRFSRASISALMKAGRSW